MGSLPKSKEERIYSVDKKKKTKKGVSGAPVDQETLTSL